MSRIGKKPILLPEGVQVSIEETTLRFTGKKGELTMEFDPQYVSFALEDGVLVATRKDETRTSVSRHGLYRSLAANCIEGVSNGFEKKLEIIGVGYRGAVKGNSIEFNLGFSHPVVHAIPEGITAEFEKENPNTLVISGIDKQLVGQVAADIREYRKPEPYKGKGIRYQGEYILRKAGKSNAK